MIAQHEIHGDYHWTHHGRGVLPKLPPAFLHVVTLAVGKTTEVEVYAAVIVRVDQT